mmetsp:Transcript_33664/g.64937  ORF Transcript_33664/g.64937 Transcript_33664/m.64937 type:complete len:418 (-) Transcript_33664:116-1369(-)
MMLIACLASVAFLPGIWKQEAHLGQLNSAHTRQQSAVLFRKPAELHPHTPAARRLEAILERCEEGPAPDYRPTLWAKNRFANLGLYMFKVEADRALRRGPFIKWQSISPDLDIAWSDCDDTQALPSDAPLLLILHTLTGTAASAQWLVRAATQRGWRTCVLVRRGHARTLASPSFNLLGDVDDAKEQVRHAKTAYPDAQLTAMVGLSAGSGLLVSYLGQEGDRAEVDAACAVCPAYDVAQAFTRLKDEFPLTDRFLLNDVKRKFVKSNEEILRDFSPAAFDRCIQARTLHEFFGAHAPFALRNPNAKAEDYFTICNPMAYYHGLRVPLFILSSCDDMVCHKRQIRDDLAKVTPGVALLRTQEGSHLAFNEGVFGQRSYVIRSIFNFLNAALHTETELGSHRTMVQRKAPWKSRDSQD